MSADAAGQAKVPNSLINASGINRKFGQFIF